MTSIPSGKLRLLALAAAGVGVAIGAAVLMTRGPDPEVLPQMVKVTHDGQAPVWVQAREVTITEWNRCHDAGACTLHLRPPPRAAAGVDWPATGLNYVDVSEYLAWINRMTRHKFRLPTSAEWNRISRPVMPDAPDPIFTDPNLTWASAYLTENLVDRRLRPSASWSVTPEGIWDLDGNVWEWTQDCYKGLPSGDCPAFFVGGEHEAVIPFLVRDPARGGCAVGSPPPHLGLRLVTDRRLRR